MAHDIIIIINGIDSLNGAAATGKLKTLKDKAVAVDANLPNLSGSKHLRAENALEDTQDWLTISGSYGGACSQADALIDLLSEFE